MESPEHKKAMVLANQVLDRPYADPDDDLAVLARQFLRGTEQIAALRVVLKRAGDAIPRCGQCNPDDEEYRPCLGCSIAKVVAHTGFA